MDSVTVTLENSEQIVPITAKIFTIGRSPSSEMVIRHPSISKDHAYIQIQHNRVVLKDLESLNGTKVNDVRIDKGGLVELSNGDTVEFGKTEIVYKVTIRLQEKQPTIISSTSKKDKKINLKDMFKPIDDSDETRQNLASNLRQTDPMVFQKKIKVSNTKDSLKDTKSLHSSRPLISQRPAPIGPAERRIQFSNFNQFLKEIEVPEEQQIKLEQLRKSHELTTLKEKQLDRIKQQNRKMQIEKATLQAQRLQAQRQVLRQKQHLQKQIEQERMKIQQQKEAFMKKIEDEYQQRLQTEVQSRKQALLEEEAKEKQMSKKKSQLQKLKKEAQLQAQTIAKEYQAIYRQTLQKTRKSVLRFQDLERDLQNSIKSRHVQKQQLESKLQQQQIAFNQTKKIFAEINSKNKALILYASELQILIQKSNPKRNKEDTTQQQKQAQGFRKLMTLKNQQISSLKLQADEGWRKFLSVNSRSANQIKMIKQNIQKAVEMKQELFEYIQREKEAQAKWEADLLHNTQLSEKIKNVTVELNRGTDNLEVMMRDNTKRLCDYHLQFIKLLRKTHEDKRRAAEYLVQQLVMIEKQKHNIVIDNERMHFRIEELIFNMQTTRQESKFWSELLFGDVHGQAPYSQLESLKNKIVDLTEQIQQVQINSAVNSLLRLSRQFQSTEASVAGQRDKHNKLTQKINKTLGSGQGLQSILDFFANMLLERDAELQRIYSEQEQVKKQTQVLSNQTEVLSENFNQVTRTYQRFKKNQMEIARQMLDKMKK